MERLDGRDLRLFDRHRRDWKDLASVDPYHAIDNTRSKADKEKVLGSGEPWLSACLARLKGLGWDTPEHGRALDFGCGVGRLARPLASRFERVIGVDVAEEMLAEGLAIHWELERVELRLHAELKPLIFIDSSFDFVVCLQVLQHQPNERQVRWWLHELLRVLKPGGRLVFQLPYETAWLQRAQLGRRTYDGLRKLRLPPRFLMRRKLEPISMLSVSQDRVKKIVTGAGGTVLEIHQNDGCAGPGHPSSTHYVGKTETSASAQAGAPAAGRTEDNDVQ
jgi:2-polyprenyl-3-methyl-5-hydroxy-6-metoxy-1,4-benzoquinol methylase